MIKLKLILLNYEGKKWCSIDVEVLGSGWNGGANVKLSLLKEKLS